MRFEVASAFAIGVLLPLLETCRRGLGHWRTDFTTMFEDFLGGALLLLGAWACHRTRSWGPLLLVVAWASVTGMMVNSFAYQFEETIRGTASEPNNVLVVAVKFVLASIGLESLILSFRRVRREAS